MNIPGRSSVVHRRRTANYGIDVNGVDDVPRIVSHLEIPPLWMPRLQPSDGTVQIVRCFVVGLFLGAQFAFFEIGADAVGGRFVSHGAKQQRAHIADGSAVSAQIPTGKPAASARRGDGMMKTPAELIDDLKKALANGR
jgi:hypothetical protein